MYVLGKAVCSYTLPFRDDSKDHNVTKDFCASQKQCVWHHWYLLVGNDKDKYSALKRWNAVTFSILKKIDWFDTNFSCSVL